ncbi:Disease resistance protein RPM1 [Triticum urartu]|uniref:Disease resistance protein RPM1 n=2 Tax=Triticum urartu TaxID=4572 RepID=M7ZXS6_TRIUA|nr:Disease resistance protein RPM1 [Triticum urartu]
MENPDVQVSAWMNDVREAAYNIEDCIDLFMHHVDHEPPGSVAGIKGLVRKSMRKLKKLTYRHKLANQIRQLKALVNGTYERHLKYKIDDCNPGVMHTEIDPRLPALYVEAEKLVAVEGPSEELISRFIDQEMIRFSCSAFVSVSRKPIMVNILKDLLAEIENNDRKSDKYLATRSCSERHLIERLRAHLENRRYLVVVDDIWSKSAWEQIQCALPKNFHGSRIITTTRINKVAEFCCTSNEGFVYPMKPLSNNDSKILFLKRTFVVAAECPSQLEGIMDDILHKCDGLPLAIVNIASLLASKPVSREEWERVRDSVCSAHGKEKDKELEVIDKILSLSYCDLTQPLKTCLLYLSMFPEDYIIGKYSLVWRWIAEGFVVPKHGYTLEEVGESYFNELINRNMIQQEFKFYGEAISGRVHDIVLDFIVTRSNEENFVSLLDAQNIPSQCDKIRRLYIHKKNEHAAEVSQQNKNMSHLRSLHVFGRITWMPPLLDLQILRVLYLEDCNGLKEDHLKNIGSLIHLRYLGLRNTNVKNLPIQIRKLEYLQTLDLRGSGITELPESIVHLKRLRHLVGQRLRLPDGFGNMEALQELWEINGSKSSINFGKDLQNLIQLRVLGIHFEHTYCDDGQISTALYPWRSPPRLLQKFVLQGYRDDNLPLFPKWISPLLSELTYLDFGVDQMNGRDLHMLEDEGRRTW